MKKLTALVLALLMTICSVACAESMDRNALADFYLSEANEVVVTDTHVIFTDDTDRGEISIEKNPKKRRCAVWQHCLPVV